jgi:phage terminase large subunit
MLKQYRLNVLFDSLDLIKEFRNYSWKRDQHGEFIGKPADAFNHGIDAIRYGVTYKTRFPGTGSYAVS